MPKLLLIRHGHVEGISPERFRGRMDVPLTVQGQSQARAVATYVAQYWQPAIVYTSPLQRCVVTGRLIAAACAVSAVELAELNDIDYGEWQWLTRTEVRERWPALLDRWQSVPQMMRFPQGESLQELVSRIADAMRMIRERHASDSVVLVGHDSGIRALLMQLLDQPLSAYWRLSPQPCAVSEADIWEMGARVLRINDAQHLIGK